MPVLRSRVTLSVEERAEKQRMLVRDMLALSTLLTIVLALTFVTYMLFHSFAAHRLKLEQRWKARGELALANGRAAEAIESLRSALAYSPDDRGLQIELATALAAAGRTQEAVVYFNTLHETQPGDGMINLQLARLAVAQGNEPLAVSHYQAALDGTWNGDGVTRRRGVRLELARYLIAQRHFDEARSQLLIAAGNAADNHGLQLLVAGLLEQAEGDADAYTLYRKAAGFRDTRTAGLVGAGRTAAAQSRYLLARNMLDLATTQPDFGGLPQAERDAVRELLGEANAILVLFPAENLSPHVRAIRVAHAAAVAQARLKACGAPAPVAVAGEPASPSGATAGGPLRSALGAVQRARENLTGGAAAAPAAPSVPGTAPEGAATVANLAARWRQLPASATEARALERDAGQLERTLQLAYETERVAAEFCGGPTGDDALLLKIALAPEEIGQP